MKKLKYFLLLLCIFTTSISKGDMIYAETFYNSLSHLDKIEVLLNDVNDNYDTPEISGEVDNLPWRNHERFLYAKEKYNTPILMAAYCAVLKNPLPGESYNVKIASQGVKGIVLKPSEIFSQNSTLGPYKKSNGYKEGASYSNGNILMTEGGGVCKIATTLYNLAVLSDLEIVERHNHSMPINYVPYGQDATVAYRSKDFKFKNTTNGNILIWSQLIDNRLYMAFYGSEKPPEVRWTHEITNTTKAPVKYIKNETLKKGEMKTIIQGLDGATVKSTITIKYPDGSTSIRNMGISNYIPLPEIIEIH